MTIVDTRPRPSGSALAADPEMLESVLLYHVVPGKVMAADIKPGKQDVATVQGGKVAVTAGSGVMVNDAKVVKADIHPIQDAAGGSARARLTNLQRILADKPPPWLAKVMGHTPEARIRFEPALEMEA